MRNKIPNSYFLPLTYHFSSLISHLLPLTFILILATALRCYHLDGQSLWSDEGNSAAMLHHTFREIAQRTALDIHPPFYYWVLKIWVMALGDSEFGLRSLSATIGVMLVYITYRLGQSLFTPRVGLIAAFIAACSPLQIYYAQEARMYMLLALLSALTVYFAHSLTRPFAQSPIRSFAYITVATLGLYTHYAYPLILILANLWLIYNYLLNHKTHLSPLTSHFSFRSLTPYSLLLTPILLYLPWLPTAWHQLTTWPSEKTALPLTTIITTLTFGLSWPYSPMIAPIIMGLGVATLALRPLLRKASVATPLMLLSWLLLPIALTSLLASPAFLKFLLVATTPWAICLAAALKSESKSSDLATIKPKGLDSFIQAAFLAALITSQALSLNQYYHNPRYARDNYRGIVHFIKAVAKPEDAIILHAEGQQEIFNYYYQRSSQSFADSPQMIADSVDNNNIYPLPRHRPLDEAATLDELQQIATTSPKIYAVYWATQQADPSGLIENWLNQQLYKATDQWYGNVRLVSYARPAVNQTWQPVHYQWQNITLTHYSLISSTMTPGDILQVALHWQMTAPLTANTTIFMQLLDEANHLVGQRDAPLKTFKTSQVCINPITTTEGIFLEPGTPPGRHRFIMGLYDSQTGQRLRVASGADFVELSEITLIASPMPLPAEAFHWQNISDQSLGAVTLRGYDRYKLGHRSDPDTPLHPGDPMSVVAYWQLTQPSSTITSELTLQIIDWTGQATPIELTAPLAGVNYPLNQWQPNEIVRAQYELFLSNLTPGLYRLQWQWQEQTAMSAPFRVEGN